MAKSLFTKIYFTICFLFTFFTILWQKTRFLRNLFFFPKCRFYPSCSDYFLQSLNKHGLIFGIALFLKRFFRCHPLCEGGIDEVPS